MKKNTLNDKNAEFSVKWGIKWKLMFLITVLMVGLVAILTYMQISSQKKLLKSELDKRIEIMKENLIERGRTFISNLSRQVENDIAGFNFSGAMESIKDRVEHSKEIKYAILTDKSGVAFVHTLKPELLQSQMTDGRTQSALQHKQENVTEYKEGRESVIEISSPIQISTQPWGSLRLIYTLKHLDREIELSKKQIENEIKKIAFKSIMVSLVFIGVCFVIVFILSTKFSNPIIYLTGAARKASMGDFTQTLHVKQKDEIGILTEAMNQMVTNLSIIIEKNISTSRYLSTATAEQAASLKKTAVLLDEMSLGTRQNAGNANRADEFMKETNNVVQRANASMVQLTTSMNDISAASEETFQIVKIIDEIAFQTNLLALNAAVEAARAGSAGLGFAVVADEVRNLALRSAGAAKKTAKLIEDTVRKVNEGLELVSKTNEGFKEVAANAASATELLSEISADSNEQYKSIEQINSAVTQMDAVTRRNAESAEELASSMSMFKVKSEG